MALTAILAGCFIEDEGAIDYRRTEPGLRANAPDPVKLVPKFTFDNTNDRLKQGDFYQLTLKQGLIRHMVVLPALTNFRLEPDGEVAIVANVFEVTQGSEPIRFGPEATRQAKVIYFPAMCSRGST